MSQDDYTDIPGFYAALSDEHRIIIDALVPLFLCHPGVSQNLRRYTLQFHFPNGMWCYIATREKKYPLLGVSRGAWMVRQEPILAALFDEVKTVVGKIILKDIGTIKQKGIAALIEKIYTLPKGIKAIS